MTISKIIRLEPTQTILFCLSNLLHLSLAIYQKDACEFRGSNYSVAWAYEPVSNNLVFVLKTVHGLDDPQKDGFWTGIGFEDAINENLIDFVGIYARIGQVGLVDAHLDDSGALIPDYEDNIHTISVQLNENDSSVMLVAKFARPINNKNDNKGDVDLSRCSAFYFLNDAILSPRKTRRPIIPVAKLAKKKICKISELCRIEMNANRRKDTEATVARENREENRTVAVPKNEKAEDKRQGEVDKHPGVDVSGRDDPCKFTTPNYSIRWNFDKSTERVHFVMQHGAKKGRWWSAVGIGDNMSDMDVGILFLLDGNVEKMGDYYSNSYSPPKEDQHQDWSVGPATRRIGDSVELHFSRKIYTNDLEKDRTMEGCVLFQFAPNGGIYENGFQIHKHKELPDLYKACDLRKRCAKESGGPEIAKTVDEETLNKTRKSDEEIKTVKNEEAGNGSEFQIKKRGETAGQSNKTAEGKEEKQTNENRLAPNLIVNPVSNNNQLNTGKTKEKPHPNSIPDVTNHDTKEKGIIKQQNVKNEKKAATENHSNVTVSVMISSIPDNTNNNNNTATSTSSTNNNGGSGGGSDDHQSTAIKTMKNATTITDLPKNNNTTLIKGNDEKRGGGAVGGNRTAGSKAMTNTAILENDKKKEENDGKRGGEGDKEEVPITHEKNRTTTTKEGENLKIKNVKKQEGNGDVTDGIEGNNNDGVGTARTTSATPVDAAPSTTASNGGPTDGSSTSSEGESSSSSSISGTEQQETSSQQSTTTIDTGEGDGASTSSPSSLGQENTDSSAGSTTITSPSGGDTTPAAATDITATTTASSSESQPAAGSTVETQSTASTSSNNINDGGEGTVVVSTTTVGSTTGGEVTGTEGAMTSTSAAPSSSEGGGDGANSGTTIMGTVSLTTTATPKADHSHPLTTATNTATTTTETNKTTKTEDEEHHKSMKQLPASGKCDPSKKDLDVCMDYFEHYLKRVKEWADRHNEKMEKQYVKACNLLHVVPHVPTLCCHKFWETCDGHL